MRRIDSAVFRAEFKSLTEAVLVTRYGKVVGTYLPGDISESVTQGSAPAASVHMHVEPAPVAPPAALTENVPAQPEPDKRRLAQAALLPASSSYSAFRPVPKPAKKK